MSWNNNPYYNPEALGLEIVGEMNWSEPDYSFDFTVVWKQARGKYWIGSDAGCSCPSPFEDITDINELDGPHTKEGLRKRLDYLIEERCDDKESYYSFSKATMKKSASDLLSRI